MGAAAGEKRRVAIRRTRRNALTDWRVGRQLTWKPCNVDFSIISMAGPKLPRVGGKQTNVQICKYTNIQTYKYTDT